MNNVDLFIELLDSDMTDEEVYYERLKQCLHQEKMFINSNGNMMHSGLINKYPIPFVFKGSFTITPYFVPDDKEFFKMFIKDAREFKKNNENFRDNIPYLVFTTVKKYYSVNYDSDIYKRLEERLDYYKKICESKGKDYQLSNLIEMVRTDYILECPSYVQILDNYLKPQRLFRGIGDYAKCVERNSSLGSLLSFAGINSFVITADVMIGSYKEAHCFQVFERDDGTYLVFDAALNCLGGKTENPENGFEVSLNSEFGKGTLVKYLVPAFTKELEENKLVLVNKNNLYR